MLGFIILSISLIFLYAFRTHRLRKKLKLPPAYVNQWPIIGCVHELVGSANDTKELFKLACKLGDHCRNNDGVIHGFLGPFLVFAVTDPDDSITILNTCLEKKWVYDFAKSWLGDGLVTVTSNLQIWRRHRKIISPAFNRQVLDGYIDIFNKQAQRLVQELATKVNKEPFDHMPVIEDFSLGTMYHDEFTSFDYTTADNETIMGIKEDEVNSVHGQEIKGAIRDMLVIIAKRFQCIWMLSPFMYSFTSLKKKEDQLIAVLHQNSDQVIKKRKLALKNKARESSRFQSFLDLLLELPPEDSFTEKELKEEVDTMIVAGSDTSATMLTYALILLGSHQDIQNKVYEEIIDVFQDSFRNVEKQDFSKLIFLEAVLMETMRLYPIMPGIVRYISKDVKIRNYTLPAGSTAFVLVYCMHRDPALWGPDANEFRPQRWLPDPPPAARAFAGFSIGKRGCIGKVQAMMTMKTMLVHLLRHYRIIADVTKLELKVDTFLKPASGCEIALQYRK